MSDAAGGRIAQLDALRALAALLVLVTHATEHFLPAAAALGGNLLLHRIAHAADFGRVGVVIFFIVSGYVVAQSLAAPAATVARFAIRRVFRLYPLYWLSVLLSGALLGAAAVDLGALAANLTMVPTLWGYAAFSGVYWTLESELAFYGLAALAFAGGPRSPRALFGVLCLSMAIFAAWMFGLAAAPANLAWKSFPLHLCFMIVGMLLHARAGPSGGIFLGAGIVVALLPSAYSLLFHVQTGSADHLRWAIAYPAAAAVFFLFFTWRDMPCGLARLGIASYSIYLLHPFALAIISRASAWAPEWIGTVGMAGAVAAAILVTLALSEVAYRVVERPFIDIARRITAADAHAGAPPEQAPLAPDADEPRGATQ